MANNTLRRIIVSGDLGLASSIATHLRDLNLALDTAPNATVALALWRSNDCALVLCLCLDAQAIAAAFLLANDIRNAEVADVHTPIIAILGTGMHHEVAGCWRAGIDDTLTMPLDGPTLRSTVQSALASASTGDDVVWDADALVRLMGPSPATHARLIARFAQSAEAQLAELTTLSYQGDEAGIRDVLHKLKSAARTVGAGQLAAQCQIFECLPHLNDSSTVREALGKLQSAWTKVLPYLARPGQAN